MKARGARAGVGVEVKVRAWAAYSSMGVDFKRLYPWSSLASAQASDP